MEVKKWHKDTVGQKVVEALIKNDFDAVYLQTTEEVSDFIIKHVKFGSKVGFGGSMTIKNMGIQDKVQAVGGIVLDHGAIGLSREEVLATAKKELLSDLYLCSSNAITMDGILVNVDGMGNRIAAMNFGPEKVIIVVSVDKVCKNEAAAFERLQTIASPMNNKRLGYKNPCTTTGVCVNCQTKTRICRLYSIMRKKPMMTDITVVVVGSSCGY
ncbi:lactate utilization protein [Clostridium algoriphilum]|uniref:lactate utilization protein n=1 Tax=Clostridium algoriphilum TaxID=198347 RepID=UPI001CF2105B|nr:lactate utilization protein [Clostridium algoriphilum]MCB2294953.1 lactate utilization protein [Clostridium algoriphilum]